MLELKRRPNQVVTIGKRVRLTVISLGQDKVHVQLETPGVTIDAPLAVGRPYTAEVDGYPLRVTVTGIEPARGGQSGLGEAVFGFEAPRELIINRAEREAS